MTTRGFVSLRTSPFRARTFARAPESNASLTTDLVHPSLVPLPDGRHHVFDLLLGPLVLQRGPLGRVDVPWHRGDVLRNMRVDVSGNKENTANT